MCFVNLLDNHNIIKERDLVSLIIVVIAVIHQVLLIIAVRFNHQLKLIIQYLTPEVLKAVFKDFIQMFIYFQVQE